jgi:hypothetical protein
MNVNIHDVEFISPGIDPSGRLFTWNGSIYRGIYAERSDFFRILFSEKRIESLFGRGLIEAEIAPISVEGYGLILKHKIIPAVSYCVEWTPLMLKDAARMLCDLAIELSDRGLSMKDAHPWNILFDRGIPQFVDWGSLCKQEKGLRWPYEEFRSRFLFPLLLFYSGRPRLIRNLMMDVISRPTRGDTFRVMLNRVPLHEWIHFYLADRRFLKESLNPSKSFLQKLRREVEAIPLRTESTEWTSYPDTSDEPELENSIKAQNVHRLLQRLKPEVVLDAGCNKGWFSQMACEEGASVIAVDVDEPSLDRLYLKVKSKRLPILPVFMDISMPTPVHGLAEYYPSAKQRFQADMVLALAISHHLVFKKGLSFDSIVRMLASFTKKWLIVEFVPPEDRYVKQWMTDKHSWYQEKNFLEALQKRFSRVDKVPSAPEPRLLFFCES